MAKGVLLINTGSPAECTEQSISEFLEQFLSDPIVIHMRPFIWKILRRSIILPLRTPKVLQAYQKIWTAAGSPLNAMMDKLCHALAKQLHMPVQWAGCYGGSDFSHALNTLHQRGVDELIALPLYPQYSSTTTETAIQHLYAALERIPRRFSKIHVIPPYGDEECFIQAITEQLDVAYDRDSFLLINYHGLPQSYLKGADHDYHNACSRLTLELAKRLKLKEYTYAQSFSSRFGPARWINPYFDRMLPYLIGRNVRKVTVCCPGFAVDNLETLYEIGIQAQARFKQLGGQNLTLLPCLNSSEAHIKIIRNLVLTI